MHWQLSYAGSPEPWLWKIADFGSSLMEKSTCYFDPVMVNEGKQSKGWRLSTLQESFADGDDGECVLLMKGNLDTKRFA